MKVQLLPTINLFYSIYIPILIFNQLFKFQFNAPDPDIQFILSFVILNYLFTHFLTFNPSIYFIFTLTSCIIKIRQSLSKSTALAYSHKIIHFYIIILLT